MSYEKERAVAKSFLKVAHFYEKMPIGEKRKIESRLRNLNSTVLGFILEEISEDILCTDFFHLVEECFISFYATNDSQKKFLKESLEYKRDNLQKSKDHVSITPDTYNPGKHCDKFNRRKSLKKRKGKAYANVRVEKMIF